MSYTEINLPSGKLKRHTPIMRGMLERIPTIPAYGMALIQATDDGIQTTVSNMEAELSVFVSGEVVTKGDKALLSADNFFEHCRNCADDEKISLSFSKDIANLKYGVCTTKLQSLPTEQFPLFSEEPETFSFKIEEKLLKQAIFSALRAMAINDVRPYLNGMVLLVNKDTLQFASSDGHRLSTTKIEIETTAFDDETKQLVLPRKSVLMLDKILSDKGKVVEVSVCETQIFFRIGDLLYKVKLIEDSYPDFSKIFSEESVTSVNLRRNDFIRALHQALVICDSKVNMASFAFSKDRVQITTTNSNGEETKVNLNLRLEGEEKTIWFNIAYLVDALESLVSNDVKAEINNKGAMKMRGEDEYPWHVIMSLSR